MSTPSDHPSPLSDTQNDAERDPQTGPPKELPKIWNLGDPLQYAPPKPDGDPWQLLLEPLLKKDKLRCEAWKDEVQNLLIFAGLFSAVVTAFIVESYKGLQPDPNDTLVGILSHIAVRLDSPLNETSTSVFSPLTVPLFSPSTSSIRVNAFWFLSLVLNLTTVLVGIVSLQWLREHQSYPEDSPRLNFAIYNIRSEGLERWHVSKIFTALPLLLQFSLVLFLVGLIDFLQAFRVLAVLIPVSAIAGVTLLFLALTTLLPALQGLALYLPSSTSRITLPPVQCPYKSPQSHAVRVLSAPIASLCERLCWRTPNMPRISSVPWFYISPTWKSTNWSRFDESWLAVRDADRRLALDRPIQLHELLGSSHNEILPLYDLISGLKKCAGHNSASYHPAYHAFVEICDLTLLTMRPSYFCFQARDHYDQNAYLQDLLEYENSLADQFVADQLFDSQAGFQAENATFTLALKQQSIMAFMNLYELYDKPMHFHKYEIVIRLVWIFSRGLDGISMRTTTPESLRTCLPRCLDLNPYIPWVLGDLPASYKEQFNAMALQLGYVALALLQELGDETPPYPPFEGYEAPVKYMALMQAMYKITLRILRDSPLDVPGDLRGVLDLITGDIIEKLKHEMINRMPLPYARPSSLFYVTALYAILFRSRPELEKITAFDTLWSTLLDYKKLAINIGPADGTAIPLFVSLIEERFSVTLQDVEQLLNNGTNVQVTTALVPMNSGQARRSHSSIDMFPSHPHTDNNFSQSSPKPPIIGEGSSIRDVRTKDEHV